MSKIVVNMHVGLKIDAIGMALVAGLWLLIKNVVRRSGSAMMSQVSVEDWEFNKRM